MRVCGCGCGESIEHLRRQARYVNEAHRKRAARGVARAAETRTNPAPGPGSSKPGHASDSALVDAQMTPEEMRARLDALAREFDRAGSTTAMRAEGRALAKALGLPRPRWLPRDEWR